MRTKAREGPRRAAVGKHRTRPQAAGIGGLEGWEVVGFPLGGVQFPRGEGGEASGEVGMMQGWHLWLIVSERVGGVSRICTTLCAS